LHNLKAFGGLVSRGFLSLSATWIAKVSCWCLCLMLRLWFPVVMLILHLPDFDVICAVRVGRRQADYYVTQQVSLLGL